MKKVEWSVFQILEHILECFWQESTFPTNEHFIMMLDATKSDNSAWMSIIHSIKMILNIPSNIEIKMLDEMLDEMLGPFVPTFIY